MRIKAIRENDREKALELVLSVFMQYEAPDYSEQGIQIFKDFIHNKYKIFHLVLPATYYVSRRFFYVL